MEVLTSFRGLVERRKPWFVTGVLVFSYLGSGLNFSVLSSVLKRWADSLNTDIESFSSVFTWRSTGYIPGCIFGCVLFRYINRQACLALMYFLVSTTLFAATLLRNLTGINWCFAIQGVCSGVCDAATGAILCQVWKDRSGPFLQALYFVFAVGSTIAPFMSAPLLDKDFNIPLFITAAVVLLSSITLLSLVYLVDEEDDDVTNGSGNITEVVEEAVSVDDNANQIHMTFLYNVLTRIRNCIEWTKNNFRSVVIVLIIALMILFYSGMEIVYWEFLPLYLQEVPMAVRITDAKASYMMGAVNYGFMVTRGFGIFVSAKISPLKIIFFDFILLTIACLSLLIYDSMFVLWMGNILIGLAFGTAYPQIYALVAQQVEVTNYYASLFCFSSGLTAAFYPQLVSYQIRDNHQFLVWLVLGSIIASFVLLISFIIFVKRYPLQILSGQIMPLRKRTGSLESLESGDNSAINVVTHVSHL